MLENVTDLTPFAEGIWLDTQPINILGMPLTVTMAILRLRDESLLLYSPITMTPARRAAVEAIGRVAHLYSPNLFHHLFIGEWARAFPAARLHAPSGLSKKRPDLRIDRVHTDASEPAFAGIIDEIHIDGFRLEESVLFYQPARTLIVADLVQNVGRPEHRWAKVYTKAMGFYDRIALSRVIRWTSFSDRSAARRSLDALLKLPFDRLVVGHGAPLGAGGKEALAAAYGWLEA